MDGLADGWIDRDRQMDEGVDGGMSGLANGWIDRERVKHTNDLMDRLANGKTVRWTEMKKQRLTNG